jgi:hypothetical protein
VGPKPAPVTAKVKIRTIPVIAGSQAPLWAVRSGFEALMTAPMSGEVTAASILTSKAVVLCRRKSLRWPVLAKLRRYSTPPALNTVIVSSQRDPGALFWSAQIMVRRLAEPMFTPHCGRIAVSASAEGEMRSEISITRRREGTTAPDSQGPKPLEMDCRNVHPYRAGSELFKKKKAHCRRAYASSAQRHARRALSPKSRPGTNLDPGRL